jgi:hypothetical protein
MAMNSVSRSGTSMAAIAVATLLLAAGCAKDDATAAGDTSTPAVAASSAAPKSNCADGAWKDPGGLYCVVVPAGYKSTGPTKTTDGISSDQWNDDGGFTFNIDYWAADRPGRTLANMKDGFESSIKGVTLHRLDRADLDGGGVYEKFHNPATNQYSMRSLVPIGDKLFECQAVYATPLQPDNACKTVRGQ